MSIVNVHISLFVPCKDGMAYLENLTAEKVNSARFNTLAHGYIVPGDIVYIPFGAVFCEKSVGGHNVSLCVSSLLIHKHQCPSADLITNAYPKILGLLSEVMICFSVCR